MKSLSSDLQAHIAGTVTSLCSCWHITRRDGVEIFLTDHDQDVEVAGEIYRASDGYERDTLKSSGGSDTDEMELLGFLQSDWMSEADLAAGLFDHARLRFFLVNWQDVSMGEIALKSGWIGEVRWQDGQFRAELRGLASSFKQGIGRLFTPDCPADLGDGACGINLDALKELATVASVSSGTPDRVGLADYAGDGSGLAGGMVRFTSGTLAGRQMEITRFEASEQQIQLFLPLSQLPEIGDELALYPGCDKRLATCRDVYANAVNFRGFPHIPGIDGVMEPGHD